MLRYWRISSTGACFAMCAIAIVLWMRSYALSDNAAYCFEAGGSTTTAQQYVPIRYFRLLVLTTGKGQLAITGSCRIRMGKAKTGFRWLPSKTPNADYWWGWSNNQTTFGFAAMKTGQGLVGVKVPFWLPTMATAVAGTLLWMQRPYRFTLRDAFVATTFIAVVLGMGVALSRS